MKVIELERSIGPEAVNSGRAAVTGLIALIAATTMLLSALSSAYVVRRGLSNDWVPLHLPAAVPASAILLVLSSVAVEIGRRSLGADKHSRFARLLVCGPGAWSVVCARAGLWLESNQPNRHLGRIESLGSLSVRSERNHCCSRDWNCGRVDMDRVSCFRQRFSSPQAAGLKLRRIIGIISIAFGFTSWFCSTLGAESVLCPSAVRHVFPDCRRSAA